MLKRSPLLTFCILFIAVSTSIHASERASLQPQSSSMQRPLNASTLKKIVGFLRVAYSYQGKVYVAEGTAFFVFYQDKRLEANEGFAYLVTNRHVAAPGAEEGRKYQILWTKLRLNLRSTSPSSQSQEITIPLDQTHHWYFPANSAVDLAVLPILPNQILYDFDCFPVSLFATTDTVVERGIAEGDNVLFAGYFYQFPGLSRIEPIVREGILAMIPDEPLETTLHGLGKLYLADVHVFGGNSGSPLFVNVGGYRNGHMSVGGFPYLLLGIISGGYTEDREFNLTVATTMKGTLKGNSGIATVVPVDELKVILDSPGLQEIRDAEFAARAAKH